MFIRQVKKQRSKDAKVFYQYTLAQTSRVEGKVKQYSILYLGSDPLLADKMNRSLVLRILKSKIFGQSELLPSEAPEQLVQLAEQLFVKYQEKYKDKKAPTVLPPNPKTAEYHQVDINELKSKDCRSFGAEYLCKQVASMLQLNQSFKALKWSDNMVSKAVISIVARAIFSASEYRTAQILSENSALLECFRYDKTISHKQLYAVADKLYKHQAQIDQSINQRISQLFNLEDKLVIFDLSNTYFETSKRGSQLAAHGNSKEKRFDCPIVVFSGVINAEGFIRHSRIYHGKTADSMTLQDMLEDLESHAKQNTKKTVVFDAGIATEENLELLRSKKYKYVCVSRKRLKDYPSDELKEATTVWDKTEKNKIELKVFKPKEFVDTWMYVQSDQKRKKEESIDDNVSKRYEADLQTIKNALSKKGGTKKIDKVWERIGRAKERNKKISAQYNVQVDQKNEIALDVRWSKKSSPIKKDKNKGVYFLRTNIAKIEESDFWDIYNTIREVESTFRCLKTDLNIRPVHHQLDHRIESHIYLTILAYQLVNTIRHMLKKQNIHYDWNNIRRVLSTHTIQIIVIPTDSKEIHLRKPTEPSKQVTEIFKATNCDPTKPTIKKYVVYH